MIFHPSGSATCRRYSVPRAPTASDYGHVRVPLMPIRGAWSRMPDIAGAADRVARAEASARCRPGTQLWTAPQSSRWD